MLLSVCGAFDNQVLVSCVCARFGSGVRYLFSSFTVRIAVGCVVSSNTPDGSSVYKRSIECPDLELPKGYCYVRGERAASAAA